MTLFFFLMGCDTKEERKVAPAAIEAETSDRVIPFRFTTFSGKEFSTEAMKGTPIVLNFWASWCGPCRIEAPTLQKVYLDYNDRGVNFIGIAVQDTDESAMGFIEKYGLTFPNGRDATGEIMRAYKIYAIPQTYIIGRDGGVTYIHTGPVSEKRLIEEIEKAL